LIVNNAILFLFKNKTISKNSKNNHYKTSTIIIMKHLIYSILFATCFSQAVHAQDEKEIMLFSQNNNIGTARGQAIGGALGSIGADFSAISVNPASLGKYNKSEFMFTPTFKANTTTSTYGAKNFDDAKLRFAFDNIGLILSNRKSQRRGWIATNFALGMNKTANYNRAFNFSGFSDKNSMTDAFAQQANQAGGRRGIGNTSLLTQMAYNAYLIDTVSGNPDTMFSYIPKFDGINQTKDVTEKGGINELSLTLAGNNDDVILIGASVGIPILNYNRYTIYSESDNSGKTTNQFKDFAYTENLKTSGAGINLKIGAIYMPISTIRIGAAFHTPTIYTLTEEGSNTMVSHLEGFASEIIVPGDDYNSVSNYTLTTPYKALLSGSFLFGKYGFITADYEYINYASSRIGFLNDIGSVAYAKNINSVVKKIGNAANNLRFGAEIRTKALSIRAGYAMLGSQLTSSEFDASRRDFSLGAGFRGESFFTDVAWVNSTGNYRDYNYVINGMSNQNATIANTNNALTFTMGWKF
jgi:hypothetical protein